MANFNTLQDVLVYALFRGGEFTSGTLLDGDFYNNTNGGQALKYVNDTMEGLLLGSPLGLVGESGQPMPGVDWWWARKAPLGTLFLKAPVSTGTATIRKGQNAVTFDSLLSEGSAIMYLLTGDDRYRDGVLRALKSWALWKRIEYKGQGFWTERHAGTALARALRRPGYEIQRIVGTREPDERQLEVGRAAMEEILRVEA